jgi:hypothetical protein
MINPTIWTNRKFIRLTFTQRLLFIGLISQADDEGRLWNDGLALKAAVFPADSVTLEEIECGLERLASVGFLTKDKNSIQLTGWNEHQAVPKPTPSTIPVPTVKEDYRTTTEPLPNHYGNNTEPLPECYQTDSDIPLPKERKEKKERKERIISAPAKADSPVLMSNSSTLYQALWKTFLSKTERFADYGKEGKSCALLVARIKNLSPDNPESTAIALVETFWIEREKDKALKFWGGIPFCPSGLLPHLDRLMLLVSKTGESKKREADEKELADMIYGVKK